MLKTKRELLEEICNSFNTALLKLEIDKKIYEEFDKSYIVARQRREVMGKSMVVEITAEESLKRTEDEITGINKLLKIALKLLKYQKLNE
jgi:hypothetical protein